jgi:hypothetical protein
MNAEPPVLNNGDAGMKAPCMTAPTAPLRLLTLAMFAFLGYASEAVAASCLDFSATPFTIKIYNNSADYNIFPVVVTPTNGPDEWLQGGFQVPTADIATRTYGHDYTIPVLYQARSGHCTGRFGDPVAAAVHTTGGKSGRRIDKRRMDRLVEWRPHSDLRQSCDQQQATAGGIVGGLGRRSEQRRHNTLYPRSCLHGRMQRLAPPGLQELDHFCG